MSNSVSHSEKPALNDQVKSIVYYAGWAVFIWVIMSLAASKISGWGTLGKIYRRKNEVAGNLWHFRLSGVGILNYSTWLTAGASAEGLFLSLPLPFRIGHPPLFIPWADITMSPYKLMFSQFVRIHFEKAPDVYVTIRRSLAYKLTDTENRLSMLPVEI